MMSAEKLRNESAETGESFVGDTNSFGQPGGSFRLDHEARVRAQANEIYCRRERERLAMIAAEQRNMPPPPSRKPVKMKRLQVLCASGDGEQNTGDCTACVLS